MSPDEALDQIFECQYGVAGWHQARSTGLSADQIGRRVNRGRLLRDGRTLRLPGYPRTNLQQVMAAVVSAGPGAVASHLTAAALWRLPGFPLGPLHVSVPYRTDRARPAHRSDFHAHWLRDLELPYCTEFRSIPVTGVPLTLLHLAGMSTTWQGVHPLRVERALDTVIGRSPTVLPTLHRMLPELSKSGREGIVLMRELLSVRPIGCVPPDSGAERRFEQILADAGEPPFERQIDLGGSEWIGRIDYVDRVLRLLVEIDSQTFHSSPTDKANDARRDAALIAAGFAKVLRIPEEWLFPRPFDVLREVRQARRELRPD